MRRRTVLATIWLLALSAWGALLHGLLGVIDVGPVSGALVAAGILLMPRQSAAATVANHSTQVAAHR